MTSTGFSLRRYSSSRRSYYFCWLPLLRFYLNTASSSSDYHGGYHHHLHSASFCHAFSPPIRTVKSNYFTTTSATTPRRTGSTPLILPFANMARTTSRSLLRGTASSTFSNDGESYAAAAADVLPNTVASSPRKRGRKKKAEDDTDASSKISPRKKSKIVKKKSATAKKKEKKADSVKGGGTEEESTEEKKSPSKKAAADYICYLLTSTNPKFKQRTYVGITNNINRRLRQHNGELIGGAKATRVGKPWKIWMTVEGFPTHISSLQFEWMWKHMSPKKSYGKKSRITKLRDLFLNKERWTIKSPLAKTIPLIVTIYDYLDLNNKNDDETLIMDPWVFDLLTTGSTHSIDEEVDNNVVTLLPGYIQVVQYAGVAVDVIQNEGEEEEVEKNSIRPDTTAAIKSPATIQNAT